MKQTYKLGSSLTRAARYSGKLHKESTLFDKFNKVEQTFIQCMLHYLLDTSIMEASFPFLYVTSSSVAVYHQQHKSNLNIRYLRVHVAQSEAISFSYLFHRWCQEAQSASLSSATPACPSPSIPRCAREREARTHALIRCGPALSHLLPTTRSPAASSLQRTLRSHEGFASWGRPQRFSCFPHNSFSGKPIQFTHPPRCRARA